MANINVHAIGSKNFKAAITGDADCPIIRLTVGDDEINIFLHDGKAELALDNIDLAIRVFYQEEQNK